MITYRIGQGGRYLWAKIVKAFAAAHINPNVLTAIGFGINGFAAYLFAYGYFRWAGATVILAAIFDLTDGPVARVTERVTPFGGFFDSVVDRYSDLLLLVGLLVYYGRISRFLYVTLVAVAMIGAVMTSYTRARSENLIPKCKVGFLERPERIVLIIIGALGDRMAPVLWVITVFSQLTVIHRIVYTYQQTRRMAQHPPGS
ncbi:MAG TPA: CDP-alcohol phosphatidyltransferase family protein [Terriglobia bacterium]|jgi:CDP-diacylglycerol--glycerol-3-phosphate 3-phosphatidyltransferase|nr:CDP-alcohol phosphatidyltransferase family protein [Terriglobia bacterium]